MYYQISHELTRVWDWKDGPCLLLCTNVFFNITCNLEK